MLAHYWQASLRFKRFRRGNVNILYFTFFHSCLIWLSIYKQTNYELMNLVESDRFSHLTKIKIHASYLITFSLALSTNFRLFCGGIFKSFQMCRKILEKLRVFRNICTFWGLSPVFSPIFLKNCSILRQKQSISAVFHLRNVFHIAS